MKIWITGANGMLGSEIAKQLPEALTEHVDITDRKAVEGYVLSQEITHIINCAAYTQVDKAESEPEKARLVNVNGVENLAKTCTQFGLHLTHFSTDYIFDGGAKAPYKEEAECHPLNAYGMTKWEGELHLNENCCLIRTSWLIGSNGHNFVDTMLKLMAERDKLNVVDDQTGRPTFCKDLAEIVPKMLNEKGVFHFANSGSTTWYQFARQIYHTALSLGHDLNIKSINPVKSAEYPHVAKRPSYSVLDTEKIETLLDMQPRPWEEALSSYLKKKENILCVASTIS